MTTWTLGTLVGFPLGALATLLFIGIGVVGLIRDRRERTGRGDRRRSYLFDDDLFPLWFMCITLGVVTAIFTAWAMYPYQARYHQIRKVSGVVEDIGSRVLPVGNSSVEQKYAVTINGVQYGCEDTRCATIHKGDTLTLGCTAVFQYAAADGWDCRFISATKGART